MANYVRGARFERLIRDWMIAKNFYVFRSAGSRGKVDLICFNGKELVLMQCKSEKKARGAYAEARSDLEGLQVPPNTLRYLVVRRGKYEVMVRSVPGGETQTLTMREIRREVKRAGA